MGKKIFFLILFAIVFISCNENSVDSNTENSFTLNINIVDSNNNPLKNINVSIWDKINSTNIKKKISQSNILAATTIGFALPQECFVSMNMYNLDNENIDRVVYKELQAGAYLYTWNTSIPNGVFKCKFIASSDSIASNVFFKDSIYVVLIAPDPSISLVGKTDIYGNIASSNKLLFPNLYNLLPIPLTSSDGPEILGHFTFSDSVIIDLSDETFSNERIYYCEIRNGVNKISLNWDDGIIRSDNSKIINTSKFTNGKIIRITADIPKDWRLSQNFPNPFN